MVAPLLEALASNPLLMDPARALSPSTSGNGGSSSSSGSFSGSGGGLFCNPHVAAAAATLQLRLLEAFFFLPGANLFAGCHGTLLKICCRQLQGVGGARVSPGGGFGAGNNCQWEATGRGCCVWVQLLRGGDSSGWRTQVVIPTNLIVFVKCVVLAS